MWCIIDSSVDRATEGKLNTVQDSRIFHFKVHFFQSIMCDLLNVCNINYEM